MKTYSVQLRGSAPLIMHRDNIEWADYMSAWQVDPANKDVSIKGDDRTPAWRWLGCLYHDAAGIFSIPQENVMRAIMEGGAMVLVPGGRSGKTFKSQTQSGMMSVDPFWPLSVGKAGRINFSSVEPLKDEPEYKKHIQAARALGFDLLCKRVKISSSKHVRIRPVFQDWTLSGELTVWDDQITAEVLKNILQRAGQYKGLGDWRPGSKTPGPYGTFAASIKAQ